jgi:hypothetical protein
MAPPKPPVAIRWRAFKSRFNPFYRARRAAYFRGIHGGSPTWAYVLLGINLLDRARKATRKRPELVAREVLKPGQSVSFRTIVPPTRSERKAAKRAAKAG